MVVGSEAAEDVASGLIDNHIFELCKMNINQQSALEMLDWFLGEGDLADGALDHFSHELLAVQHAAGLLVLLDEDLDLVQQLTVHQLVLRDQGQHAVDLAVQAFVLLEGSEVLLPELLLLCDNHIQVVLLAADGALNG